MPKAVCSTVSNVRIVDHNTLWYRVGVRKMADFVNAGMCKLLDNGGKVTAEVEIDVQRLTRAGFSGYGDVIELAEEPSEVINRGHCDRYTDLANLSFTEGGQCGISLFQAKPYVLPHTLDLLERHPLGSQAFIPMHKEPFLIIVAPDNNGMPGEPVAFATSGSQAVNYHRNTWHGVLTPVGREGLFAVVDRIGGTGSNLEEHTLNTPFRIVDTNRLLA